MTEIVTRAYDRNRPYLGKSRAVKGCRRGDSNPHARRRQILRMAPLAARPSTHGENGREWNPRKGTVTARHCDPDVTHREAARRLA